MSSSNPVENGSKGKIRNLFSKCVTIPGSSIYRLWSQATMRRVDFVSKCLKRLPEVSLNCHVSATFSLNSSKLPEKPDYEKLERCRKIAEIEHEIRRLEYNLSRKF